MNAAYNLNQMIRRGAAVRRPYGLMVLAFVMFAGVFSSCDKAIVPADLSSMIVVQGYLFANQPVDSIVISKSLPIDAYFSDSTSRISGAIVTLVVNGNSYTLVEDPRNMGSYRMGGTPLMIRSGDSCALSVTALGTTASSSTVVPDSFAWSGAFPDSLNYDENAFPMGPEFFWTRAPRKISYAISVEALDTLIYSINGADTIWNQRVLRADGERSTRPRPLAQYLFPLTTEQGEIGGFMFNWYGRHSLNVFAVDTNFYDFLRQISAGRTYRPELNHIKNGLGVFGSAGVVRREFFVKE